MPTLDITSSRSLRQYLWRYTLLTHRWAGICVGIIVLMWCISGIIMMYVQYPALEPKEQLVSLQPLDADQCCREELSASISSKVSGQYLLETLSGKAVLRFPSGAEGQRVLDIESGQWLDSWSEKNLHAIGTEYAAQQGWETPDEIRLVDRDQWTVHGRFNAHRPMFKFENPQGWHWYVSTSTAQVVQVTGRAERFWNWLGSVPHWLYLTVLRQHTAVWAQVVIWLTLISLFLTVTGIIIGVKQFRWRHETQKSPYRAWALWHHFAGLLFGLFTLTWIFSGLFSMNPWGILESRSFAAERAVLNGVSHSIAEVIDTVDQVLPAIPEGTVRLESAYWLGEPHFLAWNAHGEIIRIAADGTASVISEADVVRALAALRLKDGAFERLVDEDAYYYGLHEDVRLPAWRIVDAVGDRLYVSEADGQLSATVDHRAAPNRWLFEALHSLDFHSLLRARPLWDLLMLVLLTGVTIGVGTGTWLGIRRLSR